MTPADRQGANAALTDGRQTLAHLDRVRGPEDTAADIIDLWNSAERALRALVGQESLGGQQLVRVARQGEIISLDQAHSLLEFLAARDRVNRTSYTPTPGDKEAARTGFAALERAVSGSSAPAHDDSPYSDSPYAPPSPYSPQGARAAAAAPQVSKANVPYEGPAATPPGGYSVAATSGDRWRAAPHWLKLGVPLLILALIIGGYFAMAGRGGYDSHLNSGITAMQNGQRESARQNFAQAARDDDTKAEPHIFLARLSREDGDLATARAQLDEALRLEPKNHVALREMGLVMFASRNYDVARRFFVRAAAADPTDRAAQGYLGCTLMRLNRTVEATTFLNHAGSGAWSTCAAPPPIPQPTL